MKDWVVCEAEGDRDVATGIADRVLVAWHDWAEGSLDSLRNWRGVAPNSTFTPWKKVSELARDARIRTYGSYGRGHRGGAYVEA